MPIRPRAANPISSLALRKNGCHSSTNVLAPVPGKSDWWPLASLKFIAADINPPPTTTSVLSKKNRL